MDTAITIVQILLTLLFTSGGLLKLALPYARFVKLPAQSWANDFKPGQVRLIGVFELAAALGMIVPLVSPSLAILTPLAAVGGALVMAGAMATHLRRAEYPNMVGNLVWLGLALFVAYSGLVGFAV
ncbi:MAG: DoxX family protein [Chloroflexota bacterium]